MTGSPGEDRGRGQGERGVSTVEFALVFCFVVLPVMFGIIQYGYQYWALSTADAAAREAARALSVGTDVACTTTLARSRVDQPAVGTSSPVVGVTYATASGAPGTAAVGGIVTVRVRFQSLDVGFLPLPDGGAIDRTAQARVENVPASPLPC